MLSYLLCYRLHNLKVLGSQVLSEFLFLLLSSKVFPSSFISGGEEIIWLLTILKIALCLNMLLHSPWPSWS